MFQASRRTSAVLRVVRELRSISGTSGQSGVLGQQIDPQERLAEQRGQEPEQHQKVAAGEQRGEREQRVEAEQRPRLAHDAGARMRPDERLLDPPAGMAQRGRDALAASRAGR